MFDICLVSEIRRFIQSHDDWKYSFIADDEYLKYDIEKQNREYWLEILKRSVLSSLLSLCKLNHWISAIDANIKINNYYSFCASLRGFIESCADTIYSLKKVPLTIAKDFYAIDHSMHNFEGIVITHELLENELIHYLQAKKLSKEEIRKLSNTYQAKHISDYIGSVDGITEEVKKLYGYLCGITHPGADSNNIFLFDHDGHLIVCGDSYLMEEQLIKMIIDEQKNVVNELFKHTAFYAFEILELLNKFKIKELSFVIPMNISVFSNNLWNEVEKLVLESELIYKNAIKYDKYV